MLATNHNSCVYLSQSLSLSLHLYTVWRKVCYAPVNFGKAIWLLKISASFEKLSSLSSDGPGIVASLRLKNEIGERQDSLRRLGWACASMLIASIQTGRIHLACFTVWVRSLTLPPLSVACIWKPRLSNLYKNRNVLKIVLKKNATWLYYSNKAYTQCKNFVCFLCPNSKRILVFCRTAQQNFNLFSIALYQTLNVQ